MINDPIEEYRKRNLDEYRNRNGGDAADESSRGSSAPFGSTGQDFGGYTDGSFGDQGRTGDGDRGIEKESRRARQRRRRLIDDGGSLAERGDQITGPIGLTRDGAIEEKRPVGRPRKIRDIGEKISEAIPTLKARTLSQKEIDDYRERLPSLLQSYFEYLDKFLEWRTGTVELTIWSSVNDTEAKAFADILLRSGSNNKYAAETVRRLIAGEDYITVGVMFVPRMIMTVEVLRNARGNKRRAVQSKSAG